MMPRRLPTVPIAALALALAAVSPRHAAAQFFPTDGDTSVIAVTAMGEATVAPGGIVLYATFSGTGADPEGAVIAAAADRERALAALRELDVAGADVALTGVGFGSGDPRRGPPGAAEPESWAGLYGLRVTIRDLGQVDDVLKALAGSGLSQISYSVVLPPEGTGDAVRSATRRAVESARSQAEALAAAAGVRLGPLVRITTLPDYSALSQDVRQFGGFMDPSARIIHDDVVVRSSVNMVWRIEQ